MKSKEHNNIIFIRIDPSEEICEKIIEICKIYKIKNAIILSGIGQIEKVKIGFYNKEGYYHKTAFEKPLEILSLTGNISKQNKDYSLHSHISLGDKNKNVFGGHLIEGNISVTCEIFLLKIDLNLYRKFDSNKSLYLLEFE